MNQLVTAMATRRPTRREVFTAKHTVSFKIRSKFADGFTGGVFSMLKRLRRKKAKARTTAQVLPLRGNNGMEGAAAFPELLFECLRAIVSSLEEKDSYTHGHSLRVAEYAVLLGEALGMHDQDLRDLELSALLHDIGKIGIPDHVLLKPGRLTKAEFEIMKSHPARTARILEKISSLERIIPGVKYHHERWDGLGYPEGLREEDIPLFARIILIADTYDAMTSTRPYRLALDKSVAFEELRRCSGTQFDGKLVEVFIAAVEGGAGRTRKPMTKKIA